MSCRGLSDVGEILANDVAFYRNVAPTDVTTWLPDYARSGIPGTVGRSPDLTRSIVGLLARGRRLLPGPEVVYLAGPSVEWHCGEVSPRPAEPGGMSLLGDSTPLTLTLLQCRTIIRGSV